MGSGSAADDLYASRDVTEVAGGTATFLSLAIEPDEKGLAQNEQTFGERKAKEIARLNRIKWFAMPYALLGRSAA
jgi:hypothetical protein